MGPALPLKSVTKGFRESVVLTTATIGAALWVAAKFYRAGILIYGKRLTFSELGRWLRYG